MYDHSSHRRKNIFHYKRNIKINGKQIIKMPEKGKYVKFQTFE